MVSALNCMLFPQCWNQFERDTLVHCCADTMQEGVYDSMSLGLRLSRCAGQPSHLFYARHQKSKPLAHQCGSVELDVICHTAWQHVQQSVAGSACSTA